MKVLSCSDYEHIICWTPSGMSFSIEKPKLFTAEILPEHFKTAKYSSFTRKLHRWGFMRHYRGIEAGAFFHSDFQKGRIDLVEKMSCYKLDGPVDAAPAVETIEEPILSKNSKKSHSLTQEVSNDDSIEKPASTVNKASNPLFSSSAASAVIRQRRLSLPGTLNQSLDSTVSCLSGPCTDTSRNLLSQVHSARPSLQLPIESLNGQLNAAIEAEVSRRLNERMVKHALELMQQRITPLNPPKPVHPIQFLPWNQQHVRNGDALLLQQLRSREALLHLHGIPTTRNNIPISALERIFKPSPINFSLMGRAANQNSLPPTNIQGAKTA
jgi:HSF-type DNA-binding